MSKKEKETDKDAVEQAAEAKINNPDRPELATGKAADLETLSHNWQPGSPAVDLRYAGVADTAVNVVQQANAQLAKEDKNAPQPYEPKKKAISEEEFERRTHLDVSNPNYINPSLGHNEVK